eukprot:jgi/Ulvmu1/1091/UM106_0007.1
MSTAEFEWVPAQDITRIGPDFRSLESTVRGFKVGHSSTANTTKTQPAVKAAAEAELREADADEMMDVVPHEGPISAPGASQVRDVVGLGSKSSRSWKLASTARTSASVKKSKASWDQKMKQKKERQLNQLNAQDARQKYKETVKQRERQKAAALQRKEDNRKKNDAAQGQVLSAAAAKKLMKNKKQHKQVVAC